MGIPGLRLDFIAHFLNARALRERMMFMVFAGALVLTADYFLWLRPVAKAFTETWTAQSTLEAQLEQLKEDKKNGPMIQKKWEAVQRELEEKESRIGTSNQVAGLLEDLSKQAFDSGVRIMSLKPIETTASSIAKLYYSVPIQISCVAGMHELGAFCMRLETGGIFFKVTDLKIAANPANERKHSVEMMVETYRKA